MPPEIESLAHIEETLDFRQPDVDEIRELQEQINVIASQLGVEPPEINPLPRFVAQPLSPTQRQAIDAVLAPIYAARGVKLQQVLEKAQIQECNQPMVPLPRQLAQAGVIASFSNRPFPQASGGGERIFWARQEVANKLVPVTKALNAINLKPHFVDGFRPVGVQEGMFWRRIGLVVRDNPTWGESEQALGQNWDKVCNEARSKTAINPKIAGHKAGAAVDIMLHQLNGKALDIGNIYPQGGALVAQEFPYLTQRQWQNRMLFTLSMQMAGFSVYAYENWHASFGDTLDALNPDGTLKTAQYGPIKGFNPATGEINPYNPSEYEAPFFTRDEIITAWQEFLPGNATLD